MSDPQQPNPFQSPSGPVWNYSAGAQTFVRTAPAAPARRGLPAWAIVLIVFGGFVTLFTIIGIVGAFYLVSHVLNVPRAEISCQLLGGPAQPRLTAGGLPDLRGTWTGEMRAYGGSYVSDSRKAVMLITAQSGAHVDGLLAVEAPGHSVCELHVEGNLSPGGQVLHIYETSVLHGPELNTQWILGSRDLRLTPDALQASGDGVDHFGTRDHSDLSHVSNAVARVEADPLNP